MTDIYHEIKEYFAGVDEVVVNSGKGAQGIKYNGKMFCMFHKGDIMLQFSEEKVRKLINDGTGREVSYAKNRVIIPVEHNDKWIELTRESLEDRKSL